MPQRVRDLFTPWEGYRACFQCGRPDCIASLRVPVEIQEDAPPTSVAPADPSNLLWSSSQLNLALTHGTVHRLYDIMLSNFYISNTFFLYVHAF